MVEYPEDPEASDMLLKYSMETIFISQKGEEYIDLAKDFLAYQITADDFRLLSLVYMKE